MRGVALRVLKEKYKNALREVEHCPLCLFLCFSEFNAETSVYMLHIFQGDICILLYRKCVLKVTERFLIETHSLYYCKPLPMTALILISFWRPTHTHIDVNTLKYTFIVYCDSLLQTLRVWYMTRNSTSRNQFALRRSRLQLSAAVLLSAE